MTRLLSALEPCWQAEDKGSDTQTYLPSLTDGLFVFDTDGRILRMNQAARDLLGLDDLASYTALPLEARGLLTTQRSVPGQSPPLAAWATTRVLEGEVLTDRTAVEFTMRNRQGRELRISMSGAPLRDQHGTIIGAINICRDVTERWRFEQRIQETVQVLLAMAQILAQLPQHPGASQAQAVGQRLADLTRRALDCRQVSLLACEQETGHLHPVAVVGVAPEEERTWVRTLGQCRLEDALDPALLARLQAGEVVRIDSRSDLLPPGARVVVLAPMQRGLHLEGVLSLDYGETAHRFTLEEEALASAVAKLATLGMERDRFLHEMVEACAREGTLRERTQQMDEFLGILAHELRGPLSNLRGFAQTLLVQTALGRGPKLSAWQEKALTGLGLYLCRALVERHGGRIWCESVEGQGSTFFVALPSTEQGQIANVGPSDSS